MNKKLKSEFDKHTTSEGFIKTTDEPVKSLTSEQKVVLNRKGNVLFNQGDYLNAQRLFITTGYSDGLMKNPSMIWGPQLKMKRNQKRKSPS